MVVLYNQPNPGRASGPLRILDMHIMFTRAFTPRIHPTPDSRPPPGASPASVAAAGHLHWGWLGKQQRNFARHLDAISEARSDARDRS